jgi:hypothetical protein
MAIRVEEGQDPATDSGWARWGIYALELEAGEFAVYTIHRPGEGTKLRLSLSAAAPSCLTVEQDGKSLGSITVVTGAGAAELELHAGSESRIRIAVEKGKVLLNSLSFG